MSTTYGSTPGVEVTVRGVAITGVTVGREQKLVVFGNGDTTTGSASPGEPVEVTDGTDADTQFGEGSELANGLRDAIRNGANARDEYVYGVSPTVTEVTAESVAGGTGTLSNTPILEDTEAITVMDTSQSTELSIVFDYGDTIDTPSDGEVAIDPLSGNVVDPNDNDLEVDYEYLEWKDALDSADGVLNEKEVGIYATLSESEDVASLLETKVDELRDPHYKLVKGISGAQPNADADGSETNLSAGDPKIDAETYTDEIDNDMVFLPASVRKADTTETIIGAIAGTFAGHDLTDPVYKTALEDVEPAQRLGKEDRDTLREEHQVIPVSREGETRLHGNISTSTETDWTRDFHRVRIVDQTILIAKEIGDNLEGDINNEDARTAARGEIEGQIENLVDDGLLEPNEGDSESHFVSINEAGTDDVAINMGITPEGVVKTVKATIDVEA